MADDNTTKKSGSGNATTGQVVRGQRGADRPGERKVTPPPTPPPPKGGKK